MKVCGEMLKLRKWLDDKNIEWEDRSEDFSERIGGEMWICRTHFRLKEERISVINGYGTYGGYVTYERNNKGLLEVMGLYEEVEGYLTAKELIEEIQKRIDLEEKK